MAATGELYRTAGGCDDPGGMGDGVTVIVGGIGCDEEI
jgi:hypothetical protein